MDYKIIRNGYYNAVEKKNNEDIEHFKYIKKKKVNGKWRYYYDIKDAIGYDERKEAAQAVYEYERAKEATENHAKLQSNPGQVKWYNPVKERNLRLSEKTSGIRAIKALERYYNTPLGKIDRLGDKIDSGRKIVSKFLSNLANKIAPKRKSTADFTKYR